MLREPGGAVQRLLDGIAAVREQRIQPGGVREIVAELRRSERLAV